MRVSGVRRSCETPANSVVRLASSALTSRAMALKLVANATSSVGPPPPATPRSLACRGTTSPPPAALESGLAILRTRYAEPTANSAAATTTTTAST